MAYRFDRVEGPDPSREGVEVGWFPSSGEAKDRMLVLLALGMESWIEPEGVAFSLRVGEADESAALRALADDAGDVSRLMPLHVPLPVPGGWDWFWMGVAALVLCGFHLLAGSAPEIWRHPGVADADRIAHAGEWHRAVTALCLHADLSHLVANLAFGGLFVWFLSPRLGAGVAWLLVLVAGVSGNLINAAVYAGRAHRSLGASTAVFGALGILVGIEMVATLRGGGWGPARRMILPLGAGLALLAWLGTEGEETDVLAHLWGFACGLVLGGAFAAIGGTSVRAPVSGAVGGLAGLTVWIALAGAWALVVMR